MTTAILDRIPLDSITEQARQVRPGRVLLTLIAGALFGLGWATARAFAVSWLCACWCAVSVREGWRASAGLSRRDQLEALTAEVEMLREKVRRYGG